MALCRACRVHLRRDFPYCLRCGTVRPGATITDFVAPELRAVADPALVAALVRPVTTIGREPGNDVVLDDPSVSRTHARIIRTEHGFTVEDLGSVNGVEVDGRYLAPHEPAALADASTLHIGDVGLRFEQPRDTRIGSRTEMAGATGTMLAVAGAEEGAAPATEPLTARPRRRSGWALKRIPTDKGEPKWVLRNTRAGTYLECDERDVFLWRLLDGSHSIRDLLFAYAQEYGELALPRIERTLREFDRTELIRGLPDSAAPPPRSRAARVGKAIVRSRLSVPGIDGLAGRAYAAFGWWFFTRVGVTVVWLLAIGGLLAFWQARQGQELFDLRGGGAAGAVVGLVGFLTGLVIHESAHAFAVKSYGRRVPRAGFMVMFGLPFAFVDTSDMWFGGRWSRVVVALSGPLSTLALAGVLSLGAAYGPGQVAPALLYHVAVGLYINCLINLNPFVPLDGYQAIADALRRPGLREEALRYLFGGLWRDLRAGRRPGRAAWGLAIYAVAAIVATLGLMALAVTIWRARLGPLIHPYLPPPADLYALAGVGVLAAVPLVIHLLRIRRARRAGGAVQCAPADAGPTDAGPTDAGPRDAGPTNAGPAGDAQAGPTSDRIRTEVPS